MKKLLMSKRGFNDMTIIAGILAIFFITAIIIPLITAEFGDASNTYDTEAYESNIKSGAESVSTLSAFTILLNVMKLAFYDFSDDLSLPFWLDMVFSLLAILLILTIARNIWIGGGG